MMIRSTIFASTALAMAPAAYAQTPPLEAEPTAAEAKTGIPDIVVTARKQSERINDVPMSITAATGDTLIRQGVTQIADLQKITPGFAFQPSQYGNPIYNLRGVGNLGDSISAAPAVSIYMDQAPIPFSVMAQGTTFDVERVEVLKGPQGTLFGQNSTGGAINFIANKPTRTFATGLDLTGGNYGTANIRGYVSGPLTDTLAARVAIAIDKRGNWQRSLTRPDDGLGQRSFWAGRFLLDWNPSDTVRFSLNVNGWLDDSDSQAAQFLFYNPTVPPANGGYTDLVPSLSTFPTAPENARIADWDPNRSFSRKDRFFQSTFRAEFNVTDSITINSITAYAKFDRNFPIDPDGTPFTNLLMNVFGDIESISQEVRISGQFAESRIKWMLGGNYQHDKSHNQNRFALNSTNSGVGPFRFTNAIGDASENVKTKGIFGSLDFKITDNLTLQGSARYTKSDNDFNGCLQDPGDGALARAFSVAFNHPIASGACVTLNAANGQSERIFSSLNEDNVSWRGGLDWEPAPGTLLYGNVTRGFKAGVYQNPPAIFSFTLAPAPQEELLAYEVGFKQTLLNRTLQLNGAAFYYDYKNKQTNGYIPSAFGLIPGQVSVPKASIRGAELSVLWQPVRALTVNLGGAYVNSKVDSTFFAADPLGRNVDVNGEVLPTTPKWTVTADIEYRFPVGERTEAYLGVSPRYKSKSVAAFGGDPTFVIPGYTLLDLRAGVEFGDGRWRAEVFGRNVTDKFYLVTVTRLVDTVNRLTGMPATYGATLSFRY